MQKLRIALASVVTLVWLVGYIVAYARAQPDPTELTGLMAIVLGWAFAGQVRDVIRKKLRQLSQEEDDHD